MTAHPASTTQSTSRVTASASPRATARPPLPALPPGVDKERFEVLASLCAVSMFQDPLRTLVGCRSEPPFDGPGELPDGTVQRVDNPYDSCLLNDFYRGSFSAAGKDQAVLSLGPCTQRANDITPGDAVLAERDGESWRVVAVVPDINAEACKLSKRADRTLLVCESNMGAYGDGSLSWRFTLDFSQPAGRRVSVFAKLYQTPPTSCMMPDILTERGIMLVRVSNEAFADTDRDGDEDLTFTVERVHVAASPALTKKIEAHCKSKASSGDPMIQLEKLTGPFRKFSFELKGEATTLVPTVETKKLIDAWGDEAPEFWWNIVK